MSALDASLAETADGVEAAGDFAAGMGQEGKYVYCIIRHQASRDFGDIGIGGSARVYTVHHAELAAVVSDTPIVIYDPTRENVLAHEFVNETVMREFTVIPMSFGTVFRSEEDVGQLLRSTYEAFTDVLEKMKDKIEFGVQIRWDRDRVVESIEQDNDEIRKLKDEITRNAASS
ncbi:MAG TPA: GvpL/GvpF family gas vesicle protein, partial [Gemmatimonadaceae bacterium]